MEKEIRVVTSVVIPHSYTENDVRRFVMVKDGGKWAQPGGRLNPADYDILAAAGREIREETGLCVVLNKFIGIYTFESPNGNLVYNTAFSALVESGSLLHAPTEEIEAASLFTLEEIRDMNLRGELRSGQANLEMFEDFIRGQTYPLGIFKRIKT